MTDWNAVSAFMGQVIAWPGSQTDPGYVNLHYSMTNQKVPGGPLIKGLGWPMRDLATFLNKAAWVATTNNLKDVWYCMSLQSQSGKNSRGNPKAVRGAMNALKVKSIWIDVDVGPSLPNKPPKYATIDEALKAVLLFQKTVALPTPSALVFSGGGIHVYWISDVALTPEEWAPYASGLKNLLLANAIKCDAGLTTDVARILRVPGTLNHKYDPPKPVELSPLPLKIYNFEKQLSFLKKLAGPMTRPVSGSAPAGSLFVGNRAGFGTPHAAFAGLNDALGAGIEPRADILLDARPIFKQCGFLREALFTGGADYDNPLWNLSVLCSTFMENGNAIAHAISKGHATYSEADTQALYDRKVADRHDRGLGYPSCTTIQGNGCKACATCPLLAKGKSPLNIRPVVTATVNTVTTGVQTPAATALDLPIGYEVNDDGIICKVVELTDKEGELQPPILLPLFYSIISDPWVQKVPDCINFTTSTDKGFTDRASILHTKMSSMGFKVTLAEQRVKVHGDATPKMLEAFFLAWLAKLHAAAAAQQAQPFGWYMVGTKIKGFVYGGNVMEDDGSVRPCGIGDPGMRRKFTPQGDIADWYAAAATVTNRKRPELTSLMLMGFASPLLHLSGLNSALLSAYGETGSGKSSAFSVGIGMWGNSQTTKGSEQSTRNNVTSQMGETKNLPFYWDEIKDDDARKRVHDVMYEAADGVEKGRQTSNIETRDRRTWKLMMAVASNGSMVDFVLAQNTSHAAGIVRLLEWPVKKIDTGPGQMLATDAAVLVNKLETSYGMMGAKYAQYLAVNHAAIEIEVRTMCHQIQRDLKSGAEERFWIGAVACLICAAKYAKELGVDVEQAEIKDFLYQVYVDNRAKRDRAGMRGGSVDNTETVMTRYLKERYADDRMLWTTDMTTGPGRPKTILILKQPQQARNMGGGIEVRWAVETKQLIIAKKDFIDWMAVHKYPLAQIETTLLDQYKAKFVEKLSIGSGTTYDFKREPCIVLPVGRTSPWWEILMRYLPEAERAEAETDPEQGVSTASTHVETGFETGLTPTADVIAFVKGATAHG